MADWSSQWLVCAIGGCYRSVVAGVHECLLVGLVVAGVSEWWLVLVIGSKCHER